MPLRYLQDYDFHGHKALVRVDLNVPVTSHGHITDDTRVRAVVPTIQKIRQDGGAVVLVSHWGRPRGYEARYSLQHLVPSLTQHLGTHVAFAPHCIGADTAAQVARLSPGQVLLLENVRFRAEEATGDEAFAQALAAETTVYVNDAFATAHRAHASTTRVASHFTDRLAGYLIQQELSSAHKVLHYPRRPVTAVIGGSKVSDKIQPIEKLLAHVDYLLVGGGVANTFWQAMGGALGASLVEHDQVPLARKLIQTAAQHATKLILPTDAVIAPAALADSTPKVVAGGAVPAGEQALDLGPAAQQQFADVIQASGTLLWSGPVGVFEQGPFRRGTQAIAAAMAAATARGAFSLIGGGDSAAAVRQLGYGQQVSHISTGGSALLAYLGGGVLPAIQTLEG